MNTRCSVLWENRHNDVLLYFCAEVKCFMKSTGFAFVMSWTMHFCIYVRTFSYSITVKTSTAVLGKLTLHDVQDKVRASALPDVLFSAKFGYSCISLPGKIAFGEWRPFGCFCNYWAKKLADFVRDLDKYVGHKQAVKIHFIQYSIAELIFCRCARSLVPVSTAPVQGKSCI